MIATEQDTDTLWVCVDCYYAVNGLEDEDDSYTPDREPMSLVDDGDEVTPGMFRSEHEDECDEDDECECEHRSFSWHACHGCGSTLGGAREAVTVWSAR